MKWNKKMKGISKISEKNPVSITVIREATETEPERTEVHTFTSFAEQAAFLMQDPVVVSNEREAPSLLRGAVADGSGKGAIRRPRDSASTLSKVSHSERVSSNDPQSNGGDEE